MILQCIYYFSRIMHTARTIRSIVKNNFSENMHYIVLQYSRIMHIFDYIRVFFYNILQRHEIYLSLLSNVMHIFDQVLRALEYLYHFILLSFYHFIFHLYIILFSYLFIVLFYYFCIILFSHLYIVLFSPIRI